MRAGLVFAVSLTCGAPGFAQQQPEPGPDEDAPDERVVIDILAPPPSEPDDALTIEECEREQDVARIRGEIVVCRNIRNAESVSGFDKEDWQRRYGERTQGPRGPDLDSLANGPLYRTDGSVVMVTVVSKVGDPPPPALIIDIESLPEAPPGSDAERAAQGLLPLEDN